MTTLREIIEGFEFDKAEYERPMSYGDSEEYYIRCQAKADALEEVIYRLKEFEKEIKDKKNECDGLRGGK